MSDRDDTAFVQGFIDRGEVLPPGVYRITGPVRATPKDGGEQEDPN